MYTGKSCAEFNVLASIPFGSEYPLGDCGRCRNWENAILTLGLSMSLGMIENNSQRRFSRGGSQKTPNGADTRGLAVL